MRDFDELEALGREKISGKIVLFNYHFDKRMAAQSHAGDAYGQAVKYRAEAPSAAGRLGAVGRADPFRRRRGLSIAAYRPDRLQE